MRIAGTVDKMFEENRGHASFREKFESVEVPEVAKDLTVLKRGQERLRPRAQPG